MMRKRIAALLLSTALLPGCAETSLFSFFAKKAAEEPAPATATTGGNYKIGKPYQVAGVWYYPREDYDYDETGIASWYGPGFHAKLTANGEIYDQNDVTAAHKTLPLPSLVRVTNLENGRSLVVRINDRGPFVNGRIIDLSRRSGQLLGIDGKGTAKVRVQVMADESRLLAGKLKPDGSGSEPKIAAAPRESVTAEALPTPGAPRPVAAVAVAATPAESRLASATAAAEREVGQLKQVAVHATNIYVQVGSFSRYDNALRLTARLASVGKAEIQQASVKGQPVFRVRFGPTASVEDADRLLEKAIAAGQQDARVVVD